MKRIILLFSMIACLCVLFAISSFAAPLGGEVTDTFYVVASQDSEVAIALKAEGKDVVVLSEIYADTRQTSGNDWIDAFADGDHIELIFAENITEDVSAYTGILLNKDITLTVRYNGFVHLITNSKMDKENLFVLRHSGANINLLGSSEIYDENGEVIKDFTYNSTDLSKNKVQIRHPKVYCWVYDGDAYIENIRSTTGQELLYVDNDNSSADPDVRNTYEIVNCSLYSGTDPVGLLGQGAAHKTVKISGGYYSSMTIHTVYSGSYIKDCTVGKFVMDCWSISNQMLVFENVTVTGGITTYTGRTHLSFYDCSIDLSKLSLGSDGAGSGYALVYKTAGCYAGELNVYKNGKGTTPVNGKDVNTDSKYAQTVEDFYNDPANAGMGHTHQWQYSYDGAKYLSDLSATNACIRCGDTVDSAAVSAMFTVLGYSVPEFGTELSITVGYAINKDAIKQYEELIGCKINFGCVVALKDRLGEFNAPLDENGDSVMLEQGTVVKADITNEATAYMDLKVTLTDAHRDVSLLMSGFIIETLDDSVSVSYMQCGNTLVENNVFEYVSYNNH